MLVSFLPRGLQFQNYLHVDLVFEFPHIRISKVSHKTLTCLLILFEALNCCIFTFHCAYLELIMPYSSRSWNHRYHFLGNWTTWEFRPSSPSSTYCIHTNMYVCRLIREFLLSMWFDCNAIGICLIPQSSLKTMRRID